MKPSRIALLLAAALSAGALSAAPVVQYNNGGTEVTFAPEFGAAIQSLGLRVSLLSGSFFLQGSNGNAVSFPLGSGTVDIATLKGDFLHGGGLRLTNTPGPGSPFTQVTLSGFIIDTTVTPFELTGAVAVNGATVARLPLFKIAFDPSAPGALTLRSSNSILLKGAHLTLSGEAAQALNAAFSVHAFAEGAPIGTGLIYTGTSKILAR